MDDKILQLSIKQRLKSAKIENNTTLLQAISTPDNILYRPQHYNYFTHAIDKEIKHEGNILHKIKKQIQNFKLRQKNKVKIKNSYEYEHKSFGPSILKKSSKSINHNQLRDIQSLNVSRRISKNKSSNKLLLSNATHFFDDLSKHNQTETSTSCFKRSGVNTPVVCFQQAQQQLQTQVNSINASEKNSQKRPIKSKCLNKKNDLNITGSRPDWKNFESYYRTQVKLMKSSLQ